MVVLPSMCRLLGVDTAGADHPRHHVRRRRVAFASVPLLVLLGLLLAAWLGGARHRVPALLWLSPSPSRHSPGDDAARRPSPFSFDLAAIGSGANASRYAAWMAAAPDDWPLARLAIPGTHDSLTHRLDTDAERSTASAALDELLLVWFRCQNSPLADQLAAGVRYLDVRARVQVQRPLARSAGSPPPPLGIFHGHVYTGYEFAAVAQTVFAFLAAHPSETVVMRLKEEGAPINGSVGDPPGPVDAGRLTSSSNGTTAGTTDPDGPRFVDSFEYYRSRDPRTAPGFAKHLFRFNASGDATTTAAFQRPPDRIPTVGELRGKVLLLQEFATSPAGASSAPSASPPLFYGIPWQLSSPLLHVEDYWQVADLADLDGKWAAVRANLQAAAADTANAANPLFLSHLSASVGVTPIDAAAGPTNRSVAGINDRTGRWLERGDDLADAVAPRAPTAPPPASSYTPVGIVMADFPGRRLVDAILRRNSFVQFSDGP